MCVWGGSVYEVKMSSGDADLVISSIMIYNKDDMVSSVLWDPGVTGPYPFKLSLARPQACAATGKDPLLRLSGGLLCH